jgi:protein gp37
MADKTGIEWTDATWNPTTGCAKVSAGCKHCYAERDWARLVHLPAYAGRAFTDVECHPNRLDQPLRWKRPRRIFVNSMSDLFHEDIPDEFIDQVFAVMALSPQHTFQILTKRADRMREYLSDTLRLEKIYIQWHSVSGSPREAQGWPLPNVWVGVSVEDQGAANERIPLLLETHAAVRWISAEPLIGRVDLCETFGMWWNQTMGCFESFHSSGFNRNPHNWAEKAIDWVVVGGESGPKARPMHPEWAQSLRDQCAAAGVQFLFKQWGEWAPTAMGSANRPFDQQQAVRGDDIAGTVFGEPGKQFMWPVVRVGKKAAGRLLDGVQHDGYPEIWR